MSEDDKKILDKFIHKIIKSSRVYASGDNIFQYINRLTDRLGFLNHQPLTYVNEELQKNNQIQIKTQKIENVEDLLKEFLVSLLYMHLQETYQKIKNNPHDNKGLARRIFMERISVIQSFINNNFIEEEKDYNIREFVKEQQEIFKKWFHRNFLKNVVQEHFLQDNINPGLQLDKNGNFLRKSLSHCKDSYKTSIADLNKKFYFYNSIEEEDLNQIVEYLIEKTNQYRNSVKNSSIRRKIL